jgi:aerobic C4-dicarboxylate transport protein
MRIWIRLLIGTVLGALLSIFLPAGEDRIIGIVSSAARVVIHAGRYFVFPLVFFSLAVGTFRLRQDRKLLSVYARTGIYMILATAGLVAVGALSIVFLMPERIPIIIEEDPLYEIPRFADIVLQAVPANMAEVFAGPGDFLLPVFLLAVFIGLAFSYDKFASEPAIVLFDSLSRIFYNLNRFVTEILGIGLIFVAAAFGFELRSVVELELFGQLFLILAVDTAIVILVIYPLLIYLLGDRKNPYRWLYGIFAPALTALVSGDSYFSLGMLIRHGRENLGIPRRTSSTTFPLYAMLGHSGTAMVACISFIVILRSYSSLDITLPQVLLAMIYSFAVSFLLGPVPGRGAIVALYLLSTFHGRGLEEGYLILRPVAPVLVSVGVLLDVVTSAFISSVVTKQEDLDREVEPAGFI